MKATDQPQEKRPESVTWACVVFWLMGGGILLAKKGMIHEFLSDFPSPILPWLMLLAGIYWFRHPRSRGAFVLGVIGLVAAIVWSASTAWTQFSMRTEVPDIIYPAMVSALITVMLTSLTYRFAFGLPSQRYFGLRQGRE